MTVLPDDTGLEVKVLGGAPGVKSARYAAEEGVSSDHDSLANMEVLLRNMEGKTDRSACFRTAIALIAGGEEHCFEGRVDGCIIESPRGSAVSVMILYLFLQVMTRPLQRCQSIRRTH